MQNGCSRGGASGSQLPIAVSIFRLLHRNLESVNRKMYHPLVCTPSGLN